MLVGTHGMLMTKLWRSASILFGALDAAQILEILDDGSLNPW